MYIHTEHAAEKIRKIDLIHEGEKVKSAISYNLYTYVSVLNEVRKAYRIGAK